MRKKLKCCVPGCGREVKVFKHELCGAHLQRYYRMGTPGDLSIREYLKINSTKAPLRKMRDFPAYRPEGTDDSK